MAFESQFDSTSGLPVKASRRHFIGGSDARIVMGTDEEALLRLWREKRGEIEPEDLSGNLIVQLGVATEAAQPDLVRAQYGSGGHRRPAPGSPSRQSLDGGDARWVRQRDRRRVRGQVHAALVVLGRGGGGKAHGPAPAQYVGDQRQDGGAVDHHRRAANGSRLTIPTDALYQHFLLTAEKRFLALRPDRQSFPAPTASSRPAADRGGAHRRYERVEFLGRVREAVPLDPLGLPRP